MPVGPKTTFAGRAASVMSMPMDFISCLMIASCVVRVAFDAVHVYRTRAGYPEQVHVSLLLCDTAAGPPVQCFFSSASDFAGLNSHLAKSGLYALSDW